MRIIIILMLTIALGLSIFACTRSEPTNPAISMANTLRNATPDMPLSDLMTAAGITTTDIWLHIDKSTFQLMVMHDSVPVKTYPVVLGGNPSGDKRMEGDMKTPEGEFQLRSIYPHKKWSKFLWVNYPTQESQAKHNASKAAGEIPASASIGGEIGIHGVPEGCDHWIDEMQHWTLGCISLKNAHIDEIYDAVKVGTRVVITE